MLTRLLAVALGGALGAVLRYAVASAVAHLLGRGFPWGTLAVNALGSLAMGFLYVWLIERGGFGLEARAVLMVGLLGAFTTFSTFSMETLQLIEDGLPTAAVGNVVASVTVCLSLCWLGLALGRSMGP